MLLKLVCLFLSSYNIVKLWNIIISMQVIMNHALKNQFKVPFMMYVDFESILMLIQGPAPDPSEAYTTKVNQHIPFGYYIYSKFAYAKLGQSPYGEVENPLKLYRGKDCVEKFCNHIKEEAKRLYHMFPEKPMDPLTNRQWKRYKKARVPLLF